MLTDMTSLEQLGPAEQIIQEITTHADHVFHNRPGAVDRAGRWHPVTTRTTDGVTTVFRMDKVGNATRRVEIGRLVDGQVTGFGRYQPAGLFPEAAVRMYRSIAQVYKLSQEFVARWASWAYAQDHKDSKLLLAAFLLVQSAKAGQAVTTAGKLDFIEDDYRAVGEAMALLGDKNKSLSPQQVRRLYDVLTLPEIAQINRELGFGLSSRNPPLGRLDALARKWLAQREANPRMLDGLIAAGQRTTVIEIARRCGYRPTTPEFFSKLRWKQKQAADGRRKIQIGTAVAAAESLAGMNEGEICEYITRRKPSYKRLFGLLPTSGVGMTRAIMAVCVTTSGCMSDKDVLMSLPSIEELGLLEVPPVKARLDAAAAAATDARAANVAGRLKSTAGRSIATKAAETAVVKAVEAATKDLTIYLGIDISGSMERAIEEAKVLVEKFAAAFPPERTHICVFNTHAQEIALKSRTAAAVRSAFSAVRAGGGTDYGAAVTLWRKSPPAAGMDVLFVFVGDEQANEFSAVVRASGLAPTAFAFLKVGGPSGDAVRSTAALLGIPCAPIAADMFADPYSTPRTLRNILSSTPVTAVTERVRAVAPRRSLVQQILETPILRRPVWA